MKVLEGKAVVITGAGRGIGAACAKGAARQGAAVVVNDVDRAEAENVAAAITAEGGKAVACVADIAQWEEAGRLIQTCIATFGKIDGLLNNAALFNVARLEAFDPAAARTLVDVNVMGPMFCAAHAVKPMLEQKSGSIVNVVSGAHMGMPTLGVYGATKGAVASMVYTWAMELAGTGVRVNALSPFGQSRLSLPPDQTEHSPETVARLLAEMPPPEVNVPVAEFLLSDLAKDVNGQLVRMDKNELSLYVHPSLMVPPVIRPTWTAEQIAEVFRTEWRDRQIPCGVVGFEGKPTDLKSGFWNRAGLPGART